MRAGSAIVGAVALLLIAGASSAHAQSATASAEARARGETRQLSERQSLPRRTLSWLQGRIGLDLDLDTPPPASVSRSDRARDFADVEAGAYYRVTPRLRVGASAPIGDRDTNGDVRSEAERRTQPRVRLETIFKF